MAAAPSQGLNAAGDVLGSPGIWRGVSDIADTIATPIAKAAQWVDDRVPALASLDRLTTFDPTARLADMQQDRATYDQQHGSDPSSQAGRVIGQIAGSAPVIGVLGEVAGTAGGAVADAAGSAGPALRAGGQFISGAGGQSLPARTVSQAIGGATQGATVAGLSSSQSSEPVVNQLLRGAEYGAVLNPAANLVAGGANALGRTLTGASSVDPARAALAQVARDQYNIPITAPQISDSPFLKIADSQSQKLPFSGAAPAATAQHEAFTGAVARELGETADRITPPVMDAARTRIGQSFNDVAAQTPPIPAAPTLLPALARIEADAAQAPLGDGGQNAISAQIRNIRQAILQGRGTLSGADYQTLTRTGAPLDRTASAGDPNTRFYGTQIRGALDDALQGSLPADSPLLPQLQQARQQWRTLRTIEPLVEKSTDGLLSPTLLMGAVRNGPGSIAYGNGGGNLGDLARIGQTFFKQPGDSNTATRTLVDKLVMGAGAGAGSLIAGSINPLAAAGYVGGGAAALGANRLLGGYLRGPGLANRLIDAGTGVPAAPGLMTQAAPYAVPLGTTVEGRINAVNGPPQNALAAPNPVRK